MTSPAQQFRDLVARDDILQAVGCFDGLTGRLVEQAGGECVYVSGSAVSSSVHGKPDVGLTTMTEMVDRARNVVEAVDVPVFTDADTGYGNPLNVRRTVERFEAAGVAAVHLEDQDFPKQCGHFDGKRLVAREEMERKVEAAVDAREDLVVVARTDAAGVTGLDDAIERASAYAEAGADVLFVEAPETREGLERIGAELGEYRLLVNVVEHGKTPLLSATALQGMGYDVALYPTTGQKAMIKTLQRVYASILEDGTQLNVLDLTCDWETRDAVTGLDSVRELESRYAVARPSRDGAD